MGLRRRSVAPLLGVLLLARCDLDPPGPQDGSAAADVRAEGRVDGPPGDGPGADADAGADSGPASGPLTGVAVEVALTDARRCDLDGDGVMDNSIADLGAPNDQIFLASVNSILMGNIEAGGRLLFHSPWVDDLRTPDDSETGVIVTEGVDEDSPRDPSDDFFGDEGFFAEAAMLDPCGEPLYSFGAARIEDGFFVASDGEIAVPLGESYVPAKGGRAEGVVSRGGASAEIEVCGYMTLADLGSASGLAGAGELTMLESLLAGGEAFGLPSVPGLTADVDVDGDGLELIELDEDLTIARCIDGDRTSIEGRDCYLDPAMADGISVNATMLTVSARFAGLEPGWEEAVEGECDDPPASSLWDP